MAVLPLPEASIKRCRRCVLADVAAVWECRSCESMCCEHLCGLKNDSHGHYEATCGACQMRSASLCLARAEGKS
jgi:hypothetical protein